MILLNDQILCEIGDGERGRFSGVDHLLMLLRRLLLMVMMMIDNWRCHGHVCVGVRVTGSELTLLLLHCVRIHLVVMMMSLRITETVKNWLLKSVSENVSFHFGMNMMELLLLMMMT